MSDELETAVRYRSHAEELRAIADGMLDSKTRRTLLKIADDYVHMASTMEAIDGTYRMLENRPKPA